VVAIIISTSIECMQVKIINKYVSNNLNTGFLGLTFHMWDAR